MHPKYYERKINDVIIKCPIESGIEIVVYNVLDSIIESKNLSLVVIDSIKKGINEKLETDGGISDMAILSNDSIFKEKTGTTYGFVEVKATNVHLNDDTNQIIGQRESTNHLIYTNGLTWVYYKNSNKEWSIDLFEKGSKDNVKIINTKAFYDLLYNLNEINWEE